MISAIGATEVSHDKSCALMLSRDPRPLGHRGSVLKIRSGLCETVRSGYWPQMAPDWLGRVSNRLKETAHLENRTPDMYLAVKIKYVLLRTFARPIAHRSFLLRSAARMVSLHILPPHFAMSTANAPR